MVFKRMSRRFPGRRPMGGKYPKKSYRKYGRKTLKSRSILTNIVDTVVRRTSELKSHNYTNIYSFLVANVWNSTIVSLVPQGSTGITRTGDRFRLKSLTYNISIYEPNPTPSASTSGYVRVLMVQWKPMATTTVSADDILGGLVEYDSAYNMETRQMYRVLMDKIVPVTANNDTSRNILTGTLYFNGADANVQCQAGSTNGTNHVSILCLASHAGATCSALLRLDSFLRFTDM